MPPLRRPGRGRVDRDGRGPRAGRRAASGAAGLPRAARPPVRLLHARAPARHRRPARAEPEPERGRDPRLPGRQRLPLHGLRRHRRGGAGGGPRSSQAGRRPDGGDARPNAPYVGSAIPRVEDPRFLRGRGRYVDDIQLPGHCCTRRSCAARTRTRAITRIDASAARALDGVALVLTGEDVDGPRRRSPRACPARRSWRTTAPVLPTETVRFVGEPVACVDRDVALRGRGRGAAGRRRLRAAAGRRRRGAGRSRRARRCCTTGPSRTTSRTSSTSTGTSRRRSPRPTTSSRSASTTAASTPRRSRAAASSPTGTPARRSMTIWTSTQIPHLVRTLLCHAIGLSEKQLRVIAPDVGGGFGLKLHLCPEDYLVVRGVEAAQPPGQVDRGPLRGARGEPPRQGDHLRARDCDEGRRHVPRDAGSLRRRRRRVRGATRSRRSSTPLCAAVMLPNLYDVAGRPLRGRRGRSRTSARSGAYRGVGWTSGQTAARAARRRGRPRARHRPDRAAAEEHDPRRRAVRLRRRAASTTAAATPRAQRKAMELVGLRRVPRASARGAGGGPLPRRRLQPVRRAGRLVRRAREAHGLPVRLLDSARVTIEPDGSVTVTIGLHSHGQGHQTTMAQVAADKLGVPIESVKIVQGDTAQTAYGAGTFGSRGAVIGYGSISRAAGEVARQAEADRRPCARGCARGHRARGRQRDRARRAGEVDADDDGRLHRLLRRVRRAASARRASTRC